MDQWRDFTPPANGEAATFSVTVFATWMGVGISKYRLHQRIKKLEPYAEQMFQRILRPAARRYRPHEAGRLETDLREELADPLKVGRSVFCKLDTHVEVDKSVREQLAHGLQKLLSVVMSDEYGRRRVESAEGLSNSWRDVLRRMDRTLTARYGAKLADDPDAYSSAVEQWITDGRKDVDKLLGNLDQATGNFQRMGLYDYAMGYESGLKALMTYLDLDNPSNGNGSKLS